MKLNKKYGEWALVTGASSGIGKELSRELLKQGFKLVLVGRSKEIGISSSHLKIVVTDLTNKGFLNDIINTTDVLDIGLIANVAGKMVLKKYVDMKLEEEQNLILLNVIAPTLITNYFTQTFRSKRRGAILITGSMLGYMGTPYMASYSATKAYENTRAEALYHELRQYNIDVIGLVPGLTKTPMTSPFDFSSLPMKMSLPNNVVKQGIKALGKRPLTTPGAMNQLMNWFSKHLFSRKMNSKIFGFFLTKVYKTTKTAVKNEK